MKSIKTLIVTKSKNLPAPARDSIENKNRGFTIIEVALVLAIAGLIFLVVFLALPALQNSQKDTAKRQDAGRVVSALEAYKADNQGAFPPDAWPSSVMATYAGQLSQIKGIYVEYGVSQYIAGFTSADIYIDRICAPSGSNTLGVSTGSAAVVVRLSSGSFYCVNVQ